MELRVLRYFVESARENSMTRAAEKLHVTQPTLSRQLRDLERELGQKLFVRSNYSIHLTPEGRVLFARAVDMLDMEEKTRAEFEAMREFNGGDVCVGCAESEGIAHLARAFGRLRERYSGMRLHLYSGNAEAVTQRLDRGLLDLAVVVQEVDVARYASLPLPSRDTWGLLMRKDSPLAALEEIDMERLIGPALIVSRQGATAEMPEWFRKNYERLNIVATYDLIYNASVLVREGVGYALGFDNLVDTGADSALCFRPLKPRMESSMRLIWRAGMLSRTASMLLEEMRA